MEVLSGIYHVPVDQFIGFRMNLYLVRDEGKVALIDGACSGNILEQVFPYMASEGLSPDDLETLVITHGHHDHMGGCAETREVVPDVIVAAPDVDTPWIEDHEKHFREVYEAFPDTYQMPPVDKAWLLWTCGKNGKVDRRLTDGDRMRVGGRELRAVALPGHSPGHIGLYEAETGILFTGDAVQWKGSPVAGGLLHPLYTDPDVYLATLQRVREIKPKVLLSGHFPALMDGEIEELIAESEALVAAVEETILEVLQSAGKPMSLREVAEAYLGRIGRRVTPVKKLWQLREGFQKDYWKPGHPPGLRFDGYSWSIQVVTVVAGHLEKLVRTGHAERVGEGESQDGVWVAR